jgi:glycosyltransferase involved in cell wall biosynthesis
MPGVPDTYTLMVLTFSVMTFTIMVYLFYPLWLMIFVSKKTVGEKQPESPRSVSVILLSHNGKQHLNEKVNFLVRESSGFDQYELIIIDDNSTDGSIELLTAFGMKEHVRVIRNSKQEGIPYSMNLGVANARYDWMIFCDQRQELSGRILEKIVEPLKYPHVGAVSGCISSLDKGKDCSMLRKHENYLKTRESKAGNLMGVYGPLYAIKKQCYVTIPENIILDDLYLSLKILKSKQIELLEDCRITDDNFCVLYDYERTRRYLSGLLQLLGEKSLILDLNFAQITMLVWHKYLRLIIPLLMALFYITLGLAVTSGTEFIIAFCAGTTVAVLSVVPPGYGINFRFKNLIRMNIFYFVAFIEIMMGGLLRMIKNNLHDKT